MTRTAERGLAVFMALGLVAILAAVLYGRLASPSLVRHVAQRQAPMAQQDMGQSEIGRLMQQVAQKPDDVPALMALATTLAREGRSDAAASFLERVVGLDAQNADALYLLGYVRHEQGRNEEALGLMERALALHESAAIRFSAGVICRYYLGREDDAKAHWRKGLEFAGITKDERAHIEAELAKPAPAPKPAPQPQGTGTPADAPSRQQ